jgi:predicted ATPase/DNA-binding CsgD family transcriptional regulator
VSGVTVVERIRKHNLPAQRTSFIGRADEIADITALLDDPECSLLTLVGPGGIGKTRLAIEVARQKIDDFRDGVYFVPLAPVADVENVPLAVLESLSYQFQQGSHGARQDVLSMLSEKHLLLVMDNFEHLLDAVGLITDMLNTAPEVKILVTSREALNLQEEWVRTLSGVSYPTNGSLEGLEDYCAVQLFLDRARRMRGHFSIEADPANIARICELTEGMPLALELAAGWLNTLTPADIVTEIEHNLDILSTRSRDVAERHRSMRAVFCHSWCLLSPEEQTVFQRLSLFRGGFTREAAAEVAIASLDVLAALVAKSLLTLSATGRYTIHELLRQYAEENLTEAGEWDATFDRYIEFFLHMLHRLEPDIKSARQIEALDEIEADVENIRQAWHWAVKRGKIELLDGALESMNFYADMRTRYTEGLRLFHFAKEQLYADLQPEHERIASRVRSRFYRLTIMSGIDPGFDVQTGIEASLEIARQYEDPHEIGFCLHLMAIWLIMQTSTFDDVQVEQRAMDYLHESLDVFSAIGDLFYESENLTWIGNWQLMLGASEEGLETIRQSLSCKQKIGEINGVAWATHNIGIAMGRNYAYEPARQSLLQALDLMVQLGSIKGIAETEFSLGMLAVQAGRLDEARRRAEVIYQLAREYDFGEALRYAYAVKAMIAGIGDEDYDAALSFVAEGNKQMERSLFRYHDKAILLGQAIGACGKRDFDALRDTYASMFWARFDNPGAATVLLATEAVARTHEGRYESAAELLGLAFSQTPDANGWLKKWPLLIALRIDLETRLGGSAYSAAWARGEAFDLEPTISSIVQAVQRGAVAPQADADDALAANQALPEPLTERELEVLNLLAEGLSNRDIAGRLFLSVDTIKVHTRNIYSKLGVNSRTQAVMRGTALNVIRQV